MQTIRNAKILGTGIAIPKNVVTNHDLEAMMDTTDAWIKKRSGIETRFYASKDQSTSDLGAEAAKMALKDSSLRAQDIDLIITATLSPDHHFPGIGVLIQNKLGLETTPSMDIRNQCSGFLYSIKTAQALIAARQYDRIMIVSAEIHSKLINLSTEGRDVAVLFGDGAGAIVLEGTEDSKTGIIDCHLCSQGEFADKLWIERPGTTKERFMTPEDVEKGNHFPYMEGRQVFKNATSRLCQTIKLILDKNQMLPSEVNHFLFHQANLRINEFVGAQLELDMSKVHSNIQKYGNCSAASLPILLHECIKFGKIKRGETMILAAFGAGFTWGSCIIKY